MNKFQQLSDKELYSKCREFGAAALEARRRFAGLLPEVNRREIAARANGRSWLQRKGYSGIFEFAARLAGMSRDQVNRVLQLERRFEDFPMLRGALVDGEVSVNKLARVVSIVTVGNQEEIYEKVQALSQNAIEAYVRDVKAGASSFGNGGQNDFFNGEGEAEFVHKIERRNGLYKGGEAVHMHEKQKAQQESVQVKNDLKLLELLSPEVKEKLMRLSALGHDINEILMKLLEKRETEIEDNLQEVSEQIQKEQSSKELIGFPTGRYVPAKVKRIVKEKFGVKCAKDGCAKTAEHLHHEREFAVWQSHDPKYMRPLCKAHHELTHMQQKHAKLRSTPM